MQCYPSQVAYGVYPGWVCNLHPWEQYPANTHTRVMGMGKVRVRVWVWGEIPQVLPMLLPKCPCQDYQYLNQWTKPNAYPIPLISDLMLKLKGSQYFTKLTYDGDTTTLD